MYKILLTRKNLHLIVLDHIITYYAFKWLNEAFTANYT